MKYVLDNYGTRWYTEYNYRKRIGVGGEKMVFRKA